MKALAIVLVLFALVLIPQVALADGPTDVQFAIAGYTGVDPSTIMVAEQAFDTQIGFAWNLTTPDQWQKTYVSRSNLFGNSVGAPNFLVDDGVTNSGQLNFAGKIWSSIGKAEYIGLVTTLKK